MPRAARQRAEQIRRLRYLVNCKVLFAVDLFKRRARLSPRSTPCCSLRPTEGASCSCSSSAAPAPLPGKSCLTVASISSARPCAASATTLAPRPARRQPATSLRQQSKPASLRSPPAAALQLDRVSTERVLSNLRESAAQPPAPQAAGRMPSLGPARCGAAGGAPSALELGSFIGWRGVGRCCKRELGWGQGPASGSPTADEGAVWGGVIAGGLLHLDDPKPPLPAGWWTAASGRWRPRSGELRSCAERPVADAAGPALAMAAPCAPRRGVGAALGRRAHSRRAGGAVRACCWSATASWWRARLAGSGRLANQPRRCPEASTAATPGAEVFARSVIERGPPLPGPRGKSF